MKAKTSREVLVNAWSSDKKDKVLTIPEGTTISFNVADALQSTVEAVWNEWSFWIVPQVLIANEVETIEDTSFLLDIQKELETCEKVCCVRFCQDGVESGFYIFDNEYLPSLMSDRQKWYKRQIFYKFVEELITDGYVLEGLHEGGPYILSRIEEGEKTYLKYFKKRMEGLKFFSKI